MVLNGAPLAIGEGVVARGCLQDLVAHRLGRFTSVVADDALGNLACEWELHECPVRHAGWVRGAESDHEALHSLDVGGIVQHAPEDVRARHLVGDVGVFILRQAVVRPDPCVEATRLLELPDDVARSDQAGSLFGPFDPKGEHGDFDSSELGDDCRHAWELPRHDIIETSRLVTEIESAVDEVLSFGGRCVNEDARECAVMRELRILVVLEDVSHCRVWACELRHDVRDVDVLGRFVAAGDCNHHHRG